MHSTETSETIRKNFSRIRERINAACLRSERSPETVRLVGVSKTHPIEVVQAAIDAGISLFGENKAQELRDKASVIPGRVEGGSISWHFIGSLQKNKARYVAQHADWIESLDSISVAKELQKRLERLERSIRCLVQINVSGEESKSGIDASEAVAFIDQLSDFNLLDLRGLMAIPAFSPDPDKVRSQFVELREMRDSLQLRLGIKLPELSMGMSHDFEVAIEEGATVVRVGTALFGARSVSVQA